MKNLFILSILTTSLFIGLTNGFHMIGESKVVISNQLQHNKLLRVHCRSKDDDLGEHYLKIGEDYEFTFGDNIWGTTLFSCTLDQGPNNFMHHQGFVAYETSWSKELEAVCKWIAKEEGIFFSQDGAPPTIKYLWDAPHVLNN